MPRFSASRTGRHRGYFVSHDDNDTTEPEEPARLPEARPALIWHVMMLFAYIPVVYLAEQFAHPIDYFIETLKAPAALGGVVIAMLVATPEALAATRAALGNRLQRSINTLLGSVLSTIGLTVPAMLAISHLSGRQIYLGLDRANDVLLLLTLAVCVVTFASGRTTHPARRGARHVVRRVRQCWSTLNRHQRSTGWTCIPDYVIVGAGSAGSVLANRLSEDAATKICVLEAGPSDWHPYIHLPAGFIKTFYNTSINWCYSQEPGRYTAGRRIFAARQDARRLFVDQWPHLQSRPAPGLRHLGADRQSRSGLCRRACPTSSG